MIRNQLKDADKEVLLQRAYLYDFIKVRVKSKNKSLIAYARHDTMEKVLDLEFHKSLCTPLNKNCKIREVPYLWLVCSSKDTNLDKEYFKTFHTTGKIRM